MSTSMLVSQSVAMTLSVVQYRLNDFGMPDAFYNETRLGSIAKPNSSRGVFMRCYSRPLDNLQPAFPRAPAISSEGG